jgi:putative endonuclease
MADKHNQLVGKWGEDCAADFLVDKGYLILDRNARTSAGEIDLIVEKEGQVVFVEVKARTHDHDGYPEEAVTDEKFEHMFDSAEVYLADHPGISSNWRMDVIAVTARPHGQKPQIEWFEDAS